MVIGHFSIVNYTNTVVVVATSAVATAVVVVFVVYGAVEGVVDGVGGWFNQIHNIPTELWQFFISPVLIMHTVVVVDSVVVVVFVVVNLIRFI